MNRQWARCQRFGAAAITCFGLACVALSAAAQSIQPIYSFTNHSPANPSAGLTPGPDGSFYVSTSRGRSAGAGTVFRITANGPLAVLANFAGTNGATPQ